MLRHIAALCVLVCLAGCAPAPQEKASRRHELWKTPFYLVVGPFRDAVDAPVKAASSVPVVKWVLLPPLFVLNMGTTLLSWSLTDEGIEGGMEAWVSCVRLQRKKRYRRLAPTAAELRPWQWNYFPNLRNFYDIVTDRLGPGASSAPDGPTPASAPASPPG